MATAIFYLLNPCNIDTWQRYWYRRYKGRQPCVAFRNTKKHFVYNLANWWETVMWFVNFRVITVYRQRRIQAHIWWKDKSWRKVEKTAGVKLLIHQSDQLYRVRKCSCMIWKPWFKTAYCKDMKGAETLLSHDQRNRMMLCLKTAYC